MNNHRRRVLLVLLSLAAAAGALSAPLAPAAAPTRPGADAAGSGVHDFDFLVGSWKVQHHQLQVPLSGSHRWADFVGTLVAQTLMDGAANADDNVLEAPSGPYRAVTLRSFDRKARVWSIWWLDSRAPQGPLDPPVRGQFEKGVGTFYSEDTYKGKQIRVRFTWSGITQSTCHWEQAYSTDAGRTWEVNWVMDFERVK